MKKLYKKKRTSSFVMLYNNECGDGNFGCVNTCEQPVSNRPILCAIANKIVKCK